MRRIALAIILTAACLLVAGCGGAQTREFRVPSSAMEPTIHCAEPGQGCLGTAADHVVVQVGAQVKRSDIIVFQTPRKAAIMCGEGGIFVKRVVGMPGETVSEDDRGFISVDGKRLNETYLSARARALDTRYYKKHWEVPAGDYFTIGDNRSESCDSRAWGSVPRRNIIGPVVKIVRGS